MKFDKGQFFDQFRPWYKKKTGRKTLTVEVANGVDFLLDQFSSTSQWSDVRHIAYAMATVAHETAWKFLPIKEYRAKAGTAGRRNQDRYWLSGYYGRGYVQLTWLRNYQKAASKLNVDLVGNPSLALRNDIAFKIMTFGMHEGWFTGKKLSDYINARTKDYKNARKIINGLDKASTLAGYAVDFEKMLKASIVLEDEPVRFIERTADVQPTNGQEVYDEVPQLFDEQGNPVEDSTVNEPVDGYPEEPKPGEAVPEEPAQVGEPVVGGRPGDAPVIVESAPIQETSGWGAWAANVRAQIAAAGVGIPALGGLAFLQNPTFWYIAGGIAIFAAVISITVYLTSMYLKHKEKMAREERASQQTITQLEINADPTKYNVKLVG